jgi:hypothetical protein
MQQKAVKNLSASEIGIFTKISLKNHFYGQKGSFNSIAVRIRVKKVEER